VHGEVGQRDEQLRYALQVIGQHTEQAPGPLAFEPRVGSLGDIPADARAQAGKGRVMELNKERLGAPATDEHAQREPSKTKRQQVKPLVRSLQRFVDLRDQHGSAGPGEQRKQQRGARPAPHLEN
jgi:hypothetical protein